MVLILSEAANESPFVSREVERAISKRKPVFPIRIEEILPSPSLELFVSVTHWIDAWSGQLIDHVDKLAKAMMDDAVLKRAAQGTKPPSLILPGGERVEIGPTNLIGRSPECAVVLGGQKVSRRHAHIYELNSEFYVVDTQSNNGTYLNEARVSHPTRLHGGDVIGIGDHRLLFESSTASGSVESVPMLTVTENRTISVVRQVKAWLFLADIVGSTRLAHQLGPTEYAHIVGTWFRNCSRIVESSCGIVNKSTGDGLLAYWIDEEERKGEKILQALATLHQLQGTSRVPFRWVVHHGIVGLGGAATVGEEALSGQEVHYLFRIEQALDRSVDMAVSQAAGSRLEGLCSMTPLPALRLKVLMMRPSCFGPSSEGLKASGDREIARSSKEIV